MLSGGIGDTVGQALMGLIILILSLTVHEYSHAAAAKALGDDTASRLGRLTLNPLAHIDLLGTIILPLGLQLYGGGFMFGWAKPVPFDPIRLSRRFTMRTNILFVAAAGPASNLVLAILCFSFMSIGFHQGWLHSMPEPAVILLRDLAITNVYLCVFNLIPLGPLDGQKVLAGLLPANMANEFDQFNMRVGPWALVVVFLVAGPLVGPIARWIIGALSSIIFGFGG